MVNIEFLSNISISLAYNPMHWHGSIWGYISDSQWTKTVLKCPVAVFTDSLLASARKQYLFRGGGGGVLDIYDILFSEF